MKKTLLLISILSAGLTSFSQTFVSTEPENRKAVLEEYTGIYCTFCPDGHRRAQELKDDNPGNVVLVNVHVGGFAAPDPGDPDFRTSFGNALDNQAGVCGYPAGSVNRQEFPGLEQTDNNGNPCGATTAMGRGNWATAASDVLDESSVVNVAAQATIDLETREISVTVEAYYTGDAENATNKLTVAVLQNNVAGPQVGSSQNQDQVLPDGTYNHSHMLRHFITGQWGATISSTSEGSFFTDTYTWTAPDDVRDIPLELGDLEVAVYVAEGNEEIISGNMASLEFISPSTNDALVSEVEVPETVCGDVLSPTISIKNLGNDPLTSLDILYSVNGGPAESYNWTGNIPTAGSETVNLPAITFTHLSENTFWTAVAAPNGQADENTSNDIMTKTFLPAENAGPDVEVVVTTDDYGSETTWAVIDPDGNTIASGGPYSDGGSETFTENLTGLSPGCYTFEIDDGFGDGICCSYGQGSFTISSGGTQLYTGGEFGSYDYRTFNVGGVAGVADLNVISELRVFPNPFSEMAQVQYTLTATSRVTISLFDLMGKMVYTKEMGKQLAGTYNAGISSKGLSAGMYLLNLEVDGVSRTERVSISR